MPRTLVVLLDWITCRRDAMAPAFGPSARRARVRPLTRPGLVVAIASLALFSGAVLALVAADVWLAVDLPLWDAALVVSVLAVLASVLSFPDWWAPTRAQGMNRCACSGARARRASHPVDLRRAHPPRRRPRPDRRGAHLPSRPVTGGPLRGVTSRSQSEWLLAARGRDGMPRLQGQHGRPRG
jgi:hypothetical protein